MTEENGKLAIEGREAAEPRLDFEEEGGKEYLFVVVGDIQCGNSTYRIMESFAESDESDLAIFEVITGGKDGEKLVEVANEIEWGYVAEAWEDSRADIMILIDEDGEEVRVEVLDEMELDGEVYLAVIPLDQEFEPGDDENEYFWILKLIIEEGEECWGDIDDPDEFDKVGREFEELLNS